MENREVCIIIVTFNFEPWIDKCLSSIFNSTIIPSIVVVDNNSSDNTVERIKTEFPQIVLFENKKNLGFGKANNIGMKYALKHGFDYVFLLNQDAWIEKNMLEKLILASESNPSFGIVSPVHLSPNNNMLDHGFANYSKITKGVEKLPQSSNGLVELPFINAAFWLLPINTIKEVGGFSPLFYHYGEDRNYSLRTTYHGKSIGYLPNAFATHDRQNRKITNEQFLNAEYVYFLSELANINYTFSKAIAYSIGASLKKMCIEAYKRNFSNTIAYLKIALKLIKKTPKVCTTRTETKLSGAHYL